MQEMQETRIQSLGWEDPLEKEMTPFHILAWKIPWTDGLAGYSLWSLKESDTTELLSRAHNITVSLCYLSIISNFPSSLLGSDFFFPIFLKNCHPNNLYTLLNLLKKSK